MLFFERLVKSCERAGSLLCVGLDPRVKAQTSSGSVTAAIVEQNRRVIGETFRYAASFKPNIAFYEAHGPAGLEALFRTMELIPEDVPVIVDAKRNDIGATGSAYATELFDLYRADAVTFNPYMGRDTAEPFLSYADRGMFFLCRTSNPGAGDFQDLLLKHDHEEKPAEPLFVQVARECAGWGAGAGLVIAGNDGEALRRIRSLLPDVWILAPGIGAQGGDIGEAVGAGIRGDGFGILPHVGRAIYGDAEPGKRAAELCKAMNQAREGQMTVAGGRRQGRSVADRPATSTSAVSRDALQGARSAKLRYELLSGLIATGCFKLGSFVLKSGQTSPFYVDLRRITSNPDLLRLAGEAYAVLLADVAYDRIAGIPMAAIPLATAASFATGKPVIYPRLDAKDHGTGARVEGGHEEGECVVLLDDLITTGASKLEAASVLQHAGLVVRDLVVLIERGAQGRIDMEKGGINLHSFAHITELFEMCERLGRITPEEKQDLIAFVGKG